MRPQKSNYPLSGIQLNEYGRSSRWKVWKTPPQVNQ